MPSYRNISGVWRPGVLWRNIGGTWKAGVMWRNIGGTWKVVGGSVTVTLSPPNPSASSSSSPITTSCTAIPANGVGPFTYAWSYSGDPINLTNTTSQTVNISSGAIGPGTTLEGTIQCVVTDTATGMSGTGTGNYNLQRF